jgi:plasmid replication initiation protein
VEIKKGYMIEKRNVLNEIRSNSMTLQELRFFSIYLAKINARDVSTRIVRFKLKDFQRIMDFGKLNLSQLRDTIDGLLCKVVEVPLEDGGFARFQLFKKTIFAKSKNGEWYIEIDAHDDALPLMFEFKERYFTYELWIALRLRSSNQFRMYEILKQYEFVGERVIDVETLRQYLGIEPDEYPRFGNFKTWVLDVCQKAMEEYTDIKFTYETAGKRGRGGKINSLKFTITHNENYVDQLSLSDYLNKKELAEAMTAREIAATYTEMDDEDDEEETDDEDNYFLHRMYPVLAIACDNEFNPAEMMVLYDLTLKICPPEVRQKPDDYVMHDAFAYIKRKHDELKIRTQRKDLEPLKSRFGYLKKMMEAELGKE